MSLRLGIAINDEAVLRGARKSDPVEVVIVRSTFLNPPRAAAIKRSAERIRQHHAQAEIVPYAWHYLTHESDDGVVIGSNRKLDAKPGSYGHFRDTPEVAQAWSVTAITAEAMGAARVIVRTPPSFSPGNLSRRRFNRFLEDRAPGSPEVLWEPLGLWEADSAAAYAKPLGVEVFAPAFSMTGQVLEFGDASWLRITGGKDARIRSSHGEVLAYALAERLDDEHDLTIIFDGPRCYTNLRTFVSALEML